MNGLIFNPGTCAYDWTRICVVTEKETLGLLDYASMSILNFDSQFGISTLGMDQSPSGQYVAKKNRAGRVRDGKEWERTGKPLISLGGCNFRKGKYLAFCR